MNIDVFISFNSSDEISARLLRDMLKSQGVNTWFAPDNIPYGENYAVKIFEAIEKASIFSVLISSNSSKSFHVKNEIELATRQIKRGIVIMPILLDIENMDNEIQYYLSRQQWLDASKPPIDVYLEEYCKQIKCILNKGQTYELKGMKLISEIDKNSSPLSDYEEFAKKGNFQKAIEILEYKIALYGEPKSGWDSTYTSMSYRLAGFYHDIRNYEKAISLYKQALDHANDNALVGINLQMASTFMSASRWKEAIDAYTDALVEQRINFGHHNPGTYAERSYAYFKAGDIENAKKDYEKAGKC